MLWSVTDTIPYKILACSVYLPEHEFDHIHQRQQAEIAYQVKIFRKNYSIGVVWMDGVDYPRCHLIELYCVLVVECEVKEQVSFHTMYINRSPTAMKDPF